MPNRFPSESKIPWPHPLKKHEDSPRQYIPISPPPPNQEGLPATGPSRDGDNPPPAAAADHGHANLAPNPDNYEPPSGPMSQSDNRAHGLG